MQHDTTTHNKVVKRYKLFLHNKCCTLLHEKLGSFDRGLFRNQLCHRKSCLLNRKHRDSKDDWRGNPQRLKQRNIFLGCKQLNAFDHPYYIRKSLESEPSTFLPVIRYIIFNIFSYMILISVMAQS